VVVAEAVAAVAAVAAAAAAVAADGGRGRMMLRMVAGAVLAMALPVCAWAQMAFPSPQAAAGALVEALETQDREAFTSILGDDWRNFIPTDEIDREDVETFIAAWKQGSDFDFDGDGIAHLRVGPDGWVLPIPIVRKDDGWRFDLVAGVDEMRTRRIGRNELWAIEAALAYYDAQKEYAQVDRNGDGVLEYAQRLVSTPGEEDGLYWAALPGEPESPLGPLFGDDEPHSDYNGYRFRILAGQGPHAPGGAYRYHIGGRMVSGFALVGWPASYGESGIMTFIVSHEGKVYQRDLGVDTDTIARAMTTFDPDEGWTVAEQ
jgi:hypothetical protein